MILQNPFTEEGVFESVGVEFFYCILLTILTTIMLYSNYKYQQNYVLQGFWLIALPIYAISVMNSYFIIFPLIIMSFNAILNITYLSYGLKKV